MKSMNDKHERLKEAKSSVKVAEMKSFVFDMLPHLAIRERIIKQAVALVPKNLPDPYRRFWEEQATTFVQSPPDYLLSLFKRCQEVEAEIVSGIKGAPSQKRKKGMDWLEENGPTTMLVKLTINLCELRYEYFTESALKYLQHAELFKQQGTCFENFPTLTTAFELATARSDFNFFARVGDVLRKRQVTLPEFLSSKFTRLQKFLLRHWAEPKDGVPALYELSMADLTKVCSTSLGNKNLSQDAVEKTKQRLGLKSSPR